MTQERECRKVAVERQRIGYARRRSIRTCEFGGVRARDIRAGARMIKEEQRQQDE